MFFLSENLIIFATYLFSYELSSALGKWSAGTAMLPKPLITLSHWQGSLSINKNHPVLITKTSA